MVPPGSDYATKEVKSVQWDLYPIKQPHWQDAQQSGKLMGCALASILGALANTVDIIRGMIKTVPSSNKQSSVSVEVNLKAVIGKLDSNPGQVIKNATLL
jgi:hypothetical protein